MALFKDYVLKRQASAVAHLPTVTAPSSSFSAAARPAATQSRPLTAAGVNALLARGKHLSPSQLARKIVSPAKPSPVPRVPSPSTSAARRQLFTCDAVAAAGDFFKEQDDQEMVTVASQAEEKLPQEN
ncbi:uncharacterized protein V3H82_007379 [Fundulus diaphanus]